MAYFTNIGRFRSTMFAACLAATTSGLFAEAPPATRPAQPTSEFDAMRLKVSSEARQMSDLMETDGLWTDANKRAVTLAALMPIFEKQNRDYVKLAEINPAYISNRDSKKRINRITAAALGDPGSIAVLDAAAHSNNLNVALAAQRDQLGVKWVQANKNPAKQSEVAQALESLDKQFPASGELTNATIYYSVVAVSPEVQKELQAAVLLMTSPEAERFRVKADSTKTLIDLMDKPMTLVGTTPDGKPFTTADWKGKVILVDFWATWCGPCKEELPRVKKMYSDYHEKGLEVLGVSNDYKQSALTSFIAREKMPWPQLFDADAAANNDWNPITYKLGVGGIPVMFLIDKKGICRSVEGRSEMETLIPKLLAESTDATATGSMAK